MIGNKNSCHDISNKIYSINNVVKPNGLTAKTKNTTRPFVILITTPIYGFFSKSGGPTKKISKPKWIAFKFSTKKIQQLLRQNEQFDYKSIKYY